MTKSLKPKRLKKGDTIALITPASGVTDAQYHQSVNNLQRLGLQVRTSTKPRPEYGHLGGTDGERLAQLHQAFSDPSIDGIWCGRGGYGCTRLLPYLDYALLRKNPKVIVGYSDITSLLLAIYQETGLVGFHGPVGVSDFTDYTMAHLRKTLMEPTSTQAIHCYTDETNSPDYQPTVIRSGVAEGILVGGNLALLSSIVGTDFQLDVKGKLLFIEDIGEKPYRIDRMLTQLLQTSHLEQAAGIILGVFKDCVPGKRGNSLTLMETLIDRLYGLGIPVLYGFSFGHISNMCTLPIGIKARLDTDKMTVTLLEECVG